MLIGFARVSKADGSQSLGQQRDALLAEAICRLHGARACPGLVIPGVPEPIPLQGKLLQIYARQADGSWLLARDILNSDALPTGP